MHEHNMADVMEDQRDVAQKIAKYHQLALPVIEEAKKVKGRHCVNDAMGIILPRAWKCTPKMLVVKRTETGVTKRGLRLFSPLL
jgi:Mg/Co/Ni transporter MgtE